MKEKAYKLLNDLGIKYTKIEHPPLFTCADVIKYKASFDGQEVKDLFIQNKNNRILL